MEIGTTGSEKRIAYKRRVLLGALVLLTFFLWNTDGIIPKPWGITSMLMVPLVICIGMFQRETAGMVYGLFAGVLIDMFSSQTVCFHSIMLMAAGYFSGVLITRLMRNNLKTCLLLNLVFLFVYNSLFYFINYFSLTQSNTTYVYFDVYIASVFYTMVFVPFIYMTVRAIFKKLNS